MKILAFILLFGITAGHLFAQTNYTEAIKAGDLAFKNKEFKKSINLYFAAEAFDPSKKEAVKQKINVVFAKIELLREEAEIQRNEAEKQKAVAETQKAKADSALANNVELLRAFVPDSVKLFYAYFQSIAERYLDDANYEQALRYYRFARLSPDAPLDKQQLIKELEQKSAKLVKLNSEAIEFYRNMKYSQAEANYKLMLELLPNDELTQKRIDYCRHPVFTYNNLVLVKGGTFTMGCNAPYALNDETPHQVTLTDYKINKYDVTNAEFAEFMCIYGSDKIKDGEYKDEVLVDPYWFGLKKNGQIWNTNEGYENNPIVYVSWFGANEFCKFWKANLPTEAQWEYAAGSGGKAYKYAWGNEEPKGKNTKKFGNIADEYLKAHQQSFTDITHDYDDGFDITSPVGSFDANELGLFDMAGNVFNWCTDWYDPNFYKNSDGTSNPINLKKATSRVLRGGSWGYTAASSRIADRNYRYAPGIRSRSCGFRLCFVP